MAHTSEQRDNLSTPLCGAKKKNGTTCRAFAGQGTDHPGVGRCKYHGGSTSSHKKAALDLEAARQMVTLGDAIEMEPTQSLLLLHHKACGHVAWAAQRIAGMTDEELASREGEVIMRLYDRERDRLARIAETCVRSGVRAEQLKVEQDKIDTIVQFFDAILGQLNLTERQLDALPAALDSAMVIMTGEAGPLPAQIA
jgi:hypothetical protein